MSTRATGQIVIVLFVRFGHHSNLLVLPAGNSRKSTRCALLHHDGFVPLDPALSSARRPIRHLAIANPLIR
jgi:hypothetical protein